MLNSWSFCSFYHTTHLEPDCQLWWSHQLHAAASFTGRSNHQTTDNQEKRRLSRHVGVVALLPASDADLCSAGCQLTHVSRCEAESNKRHLKSETMKENLGR